MVDRVGNLVMDKVFNPLILNWLPDEYPITDLW